LRRVAVEKAKNLLSSHYGKFYLPAPRKTGAIQLQVRGLKAVRFFATLKAIEVNIFRASAARMAQNQDKTDHGSCNSGLNHAVFVIKEHFVMTKNHLKKIYTLAFMNISSKWLFE
jgi:hypothetical protein